jgi:hypothetical protein
MLHSPEFSWAKERTTLRHLLRSIRLPPNGFSDIEGLTLAEIEKVCRFPYQARK